MGGEVSHKDVAELAGRIQAGEPGAGAELVERYGRAVACIIRKAIRDPTAREDLYQELFRTVLEKISRGELREAEKISGFVCSIARNLVTESFRRKDRTEPAETADPAVAPSQLDRLLRQEQEAIARRILGELPSERDREVLRRYYLAEEEKEEICADLGLTVLHFNQVLCRARNRYRELYNRLERRSPDRPSERMPERGSAKK